MNNKKKTANEISNEIGFGFPKGFSKANYDFETYQSNIIREQDEFINFLVNKINKSREELEEEFEKINPK